ncbi:thiolase family protein [Nocardia speluncae]|uniref:thiolase family protein n=1 Tax=Nocardia speluncae TaxID=419477 RepID=UPI0009FC3CC5|nr:thiolase family protein [Nocardia speluncae]
MTIIGAAALPVGKWQSPPESAVQVLEHEVLARLVLQATTAAGIDKSDVQGMAFAQPRPYTAQKYFATFMAHYLQLPCAGNVCEVLGNGMTGGFAFEHAANDILLGRSKVSLALGVNFETAIPAREHMMSSMRAVGDVDFQAPFGITPIAWYAMDATRYIHDHGSSRAELATVAVKNRRHAELNPLAQFRTPITLDEVLAQPMIVEPLGLYEVPPRSDGAVCLVLAEEEVARSTGRPYVRVRSRGFYHEGAHQISETPNDMTALEAARVAGRQAYDDAGVTASDIDLAEIYAPCTIVEVLAAEALGLMPRGMGAKYAAEGRTGLGGDIPICTSGGLTSRGHPAYITPLYSFVEAFEQLCGAAGARQVHDVELALTSAELGNYNAALVHVLEGVH